MRARRQGNRQQALLGAAVRAVRKSRGLTQKQLAQRTGIHVTYISDIERGARNPSWDKIATLAVGMSVPTADIAARFDALSSKASPRSAGAETTEGG